VTGGPDCGGGPDRGDGRPPGVERGEPEVVVVGSASRDLAGDDPRGWRLGGGVAYAALASARLGVRTAAVIGLDPQALESHELELLVRAGVELLRIPLPQGPVFRNVESPGGRVQTCVDPGCLLPIVAVPGAWRGARAWILAPVAGELDDAWADAIPTDAFVALGWQGMLRTLRAGALVARRVPAPGRLVRRSDVISLSEHDVAPGTRLEDLASFLHPGAWLVVTNGAAGGRLANVTASGLGRVARYPGIAAGREVDGTGAGDTFLAALVASVVRPAAGGAAAGESGPMPDLRFAAAAASFTVEEPGLKGVPDRAAVLRRLAVPAGQSLSEPPSSSTYSAKALR
jgi:sugar/nucleoside kinase (ribokinase family)